jgi:hypothetical protein
MKPLNAEQIAKAEFGRTYRARRWHFKADTGMCDEILSVAVLAVQECIETYKGRGTIRTPKGVVRLTAQTLVAECCREAQRAMRRRVDGKKASSLSLGSGTDVEAGQSDQEGDRSGPLPTVGENATIEHQDEPPGASDERWRRALFVRMVQEQAYHWLRPDHRTRIDKIEQYRGIERYIAQMKFRPDKAARERELCLEALEEYRKNREEAYSDCKTREHLEQLDVPTDPSTTDWVIRMREDMCLLLKPEQRQDPEVVRLFKQLFDVNVQLLGPRQPLDSRAPTSKSAK